MQVRSLRLQNFKRFTDLRLEEIPSTAKLVLLVGANGCGKSSVFDAFEYAAGPTRGRGNYPRSRPYYSKAGLNESIEIALEDGVGRLREGAVTWAERNGHQDLEWFSGRLRRFYGRSTLRVVARIQDGANRGLVETIGQDRDAPETFIDNDLRFRADATKYAVDFNHALRQPVFEGRQVDVRELSDRLIKPINDALQRVFGQVGPSPQMTNFREPEGDAGAVQYYFRKGEHEFPYDVLSFGEKQVFAVLLNLFVRRDKLEDEVIYIDELDLHLNTALQYSLLGEIVDHWIPEGSQLWTASHSLGFLRYATESPTAVVFDFNAFDFDQPQTLLPAPKDTSEVLQVAVPPAYLPQLFAGKRLVLCEGKDAARFNSVGIADTIFVNGGNKFSVFARAREGTMPGIVDRDYLTEKEILDWERRVAKLRILRLYSIENYLYHPDNLAEYHGKGFDRAAYVEALLHAKRDTYDDLAYGIAKARDGYPFARDLTPEERSAFHESGREVQRMLKSDNFGDFYPVFPMKERGTHLPQRQNLAPGRLAHTRWFAAQMQQLLVSIPVLDAKRQR